MTVPLFKVYRSISKKEMLSKSIIEEQPTLQLKEEYSFEELIKYYNHKSHLLANVIFYFKGQEGADVTKDYFQIKVSHFMRNGKSRTMLQLIDISN